MDAAAVALFEREAELFCRAEAWEVYLQRAGYKDELELTPIYDRYKHLFTLESYRGLLEATEIEPKRRRFLQEFAAGQFMEMQVKRLTEQLAQQEATATLEWEGETLSYRSAPVRWMNLASADRRRALNERWLDLTHRMNRLRIQRHEQQVALARELDFPDYVELWDRLRGLELGDLSQRVREMLEQTEDLYFDELRIQLAHAGVDASDARKVDLAWVFRAPAFDTAFSAERLLPSLYRTLANLGLRLEEQPNIKLDTEFRPRKSPRAFCSPLDIPDDVRLVIMPSGGRNDYDALLHEAGHAEHFANMDRTLAFAYRWLGDNSITEAYAFLLNYLTTDQRWLAQHLDFTTPTDYLRVSLFNKLYMLRRYGTKILYEQQLHRAPGDERMAELYAELFTQHLGVRYAEQEYLSDVDDGFYSAQYLRAWTLEAQLRRYLQREFDEEWFNVPRAGKFLVELWREGQKYTAEEVARFMGYAGLDFEPMLEEIRGALAV